MRVATTHPHRRVQWRRVDASEEENSYLFSLSEKPFSRACEPRVLQIMEPDLEEAPHNNMFIFATADERRAGRRMFNPSQGTSGGTGGWRGRGGGEGAGAGARGDAAGGHTGVCCVVQHPPLLWHRPGQGALRTERRARGAKAQDILWQGHGAQGHAQARAEEGA
eukprot:scaffold108299_cov34-Phaeocystis_antarctica.AAC.2